VNSRWVKRWGPRSALRLQVLCLPHAGGSACTFRSWADKLPSHVEILAIELPGRGTRFSEPPVDDLYAIVKPLSVELAAMLERPFAIFGYSMGAIVGLELARRLRRRSQLEPAAFLLAGRNAPWVPSPLPDFHQLPDRELKAALRNLGGTSDAVLGSEELMNLFLPVIRADLAAVENYRYRTEPPLRCSMRVYAGIRDPLVSAEGLAAWSREVSGDFQVRRFSSGHFLLQEAEAAVVAAITAALGSAT
jgi:medium-chain acyl-[acyl-carrier-protein] hydrolase